MKQNPLHLIVKVLLIAGLGFGLFISYLLLREMGIMMDALSLELYGSHILTVFSLAVGVLFVLGAVAIGVTLFVMMCSLDRDPFVKRNVIALRLMGFIALGMMLCCFSLLIIPANTLLVQFIGALIGLCGLFSLVLSGVFSRAVAFKEENDLTV